MICVRIRINIRILHVAVGVWFISTALVQAASPTIYFNSQLISYNNLC